MEEAKKNILIKLYLTLEHLAEAEKARGLSDGPSTALTTIRSLNGEQIWEHGTSFLWHMVNVAYPHIEVGGEPTPELKHACLVQLMDSLFAALRDEIGRAHV